MLRDLFKLFFKHWSGMNKELRGIENRKINLQNGLKKHYLCTWALDVVIAKKVKNYWWYWKPLKVLFVCCLFICLFIIFSAWIDIKFPVTKSESEFVCWRINVEIMETSACQNPPNLTTSISTSASPHLNRLLDKNEKLNFSDVQWPRGRGMTTLTKAVWAVLLITLCPPGNFVDPPEFFGGIPHKCLTSQNLF